MNLKDDLMRPMMNAVDDVPVHLRTLKLVVHKLKTKQKSNQDGVEDADKFDNRATSRDGSTEHEVVADTAYPTKGASNREKGEYGEKVADKYLTDAPPDGLGWTPISAPKDVNTTGIDAIYKTPEPETFVIVEVKYSTSGKTSLGNTQDGQQMSNDWLTNDGAESNRISGAIEDVELADKVLTAFERGQVERHLIVVSPA